MELLVYPVLYMIWRKRDGFRDFALHSDFNENDRVESGSSEATREFVH
jgi:hypothetical protein